MKKVDLLADSNPHMIPSLAFLVKWRHYLQSYTFVIIYNNEIF